MRPFRVILAHRKGARLMPGKRGVGWWAYPVPEFEVDHFVVPTSCCTLDAGQFKDYDIILQEDAKTWITWTGKGPPRCYHAVDSPTSEAHYKKRRRYARGADLVLLDCDRPERWQDVAPAVRRFNYCVNDVHFHDGGEPREIDVGWYYRPNFSERRALDLWLAKFCYRRGYTYSSGKRGGGENSYSGAMRGSKIVMHLSQRCHWGVTRAHRVLDALGCGACLLSPPIVDIPEDHLEAGVHYLEFREFDEAGEIIDELLASGRWREVAKAGNELVMTYHTWAARARDLRRILEEVFPWLAD